MAEILILTGGFFGGRALALILYVRVYNKRLKKKKEEEDQNRTT